MVNLRTGLRNTRMKKSDLPAHKIAFTAIQKKKATEMDALGINYILCLEK